MVNAAAIILAGGKSTRMGTNKALLKVKEQHLLEGAVNALEEVFPEVLISSNNDLYKELDKKVIPDKFFGHGPLGGIHAGLMFSSYDVNFFVACDMPFMETGLAVHMIDSMSGYDGVVPKIDGYYQPLYAVYSKNCLQAVENCLLSGRNKITSFYADVNIRFIELNELQRFGNPDELFFNVNTPGDLQKAKQMAGRE